MAASEAFDTTWLGQPAQNKRDEILASAQKVFAANGFHQTEVQVISNQTGISKATIYKLFGSKNNLLQEMVREVFNHLGVLTLQAIAKPKPAMDRLLDITESFLKFGEANRELCLLILRDAGSFVTEIGQSYHQKMAQILPMVEPLFEAAREEGFLGRVPTAEIIDAVISCLLGHFQSWLLLYNCEDSLVEKGMRNVQFLIDGFAADGQHAH
jgi:AcrR family transcriptional regulator